jgi:NitT/TauT family transport system substrate-binding protein
MVRIVLGLLVFFSFASAEKLRVGLGYLPDIQFAPFYVGVVEKLYQAEGLEVEFQHGFVTELYPLLAQGQLDFVVGDAEDVIALRGQEENPVAFKYLMAMYQQVPTALFSLKDKSIDDISDLKGKTLGIPGLFGSSYTSLQATLQAAGLTEQDIKIEQIGFTQLEAVISGRVDVAMGFINNEPIVLQNQGESINVIPTGDYNPSTGNGVITTDTMLENEDLVRRFIKATQRAMLFTIQDPAKAFEASKTYVQNLGEDRLEVLLTSIPLYTSEITKKHGIGYSSPEGWQKTLELLVSTGRVKTDLSADVFYSNEYLSTDLGAE